MAHYIETRRALRGFVAEIEKDLEGDKEAVLRKIIDASSVISSAPERGNPILLPSLPTLNIPLS